MKLSKELISEIYYNVDANLKAKIENEVPEMKPKLKVGKWQNIESNNGFKYLHFTTDVLSFDDIIGYGFCLSTENPKFYKGTLCRLSNIKSVSDATPQKVKTALINEAKSRGFKEGITIASKGINDWKQDTFEPFSGVFSYRNSLNILECKLGNGHIFDKGKWAKIMTEPTEKELLIEKLNELKEKANELENQINQMK